MSGSAEKKMVPVKEPKFWYAVYTRSRGEKLAFAQLCKKGIEAYLPVLKKTRVYTRKKRIVSIPLIPSYVFVRVSRNDVIRVLQNPHVVNFVKCDGKISPIQEQEISILKKITGEINEIDVTLKKIEEGDQVEIVSGSLVGLKGRLLRKADKKNFYIRLNSIGVNLEVYIDKRYLRKVH